MGPKGSNRVCCGRGRQRIKHKIEREHAGHIPHSDRVIPLRFASYLNVSVRHAIVQVGDEHSSDTSG